MLVADRTDARTFRGTVEDTVRHAAAGVLAGLLGGFLFGGIGGRLAMRLVAVQSSDAAQGLTTDDGATTGEITLGGSLTLAAFLTTAGALAGLLYLVVRPLAPARWRPAATGIAVAAIGGNAVVSADGVDFTFLGEPLVSILAFTGLLGAWGWTTAALVERFLAPEGLARRARMRSLSLSFVALLPGLTIVPAAAGVAAAAAVRHRRLRLAWLRHPARALAVAVTAWSTVELVRTSAELIA